jgi:hypothetical protein
MISFFGSGAFSNCSRMPGRLGPSALASSRATNEQSGTLELVGRAVGRRAEENHTIDLSRPRADRRIAGSSASHAAADNRHGLCAHLTQIAHSGQDIQVKRSIHRVGVAGASRFAVAAEVDGQHSKPCRDQDSSLFLPAFLVELTAMGQHNISVAFSVNIGVDQASVLGRKRHSLPGSGVGQKQQGHNEKDEPTHAENVALLRGCSKSA